MPHVSIKLYPGRTEEQKKRLSEEIAAALIAIAKCEEKSISVAIEDVQPADWAEKVYKPEILGHWDKLYKQPGYNPLQ